MNSVEFSRTDLSQFLVEFGRIKILGSKNTFGTFPHIIWSHTLCMQAHPHRRKDRIGNCFQPETFRHIFLPKRPPPCFCRNVQNPLLWGHVLCMHAHPHRRKDQLPQQSLRDIRSR